MKHFHLNDNHHIDQNDSLYKLRPIIEEPNVKFRQHGELEESLSIYESMISYYGKHYAKQLSTRQTNSFRIQELPQGTYDYKSSEDEPITLVKWKNNKVVTAATTYDTPEETCKR
ncbi:hypothetical protein ILUMI_00084 [Ignelater luminosus]|uniref:PiggyBac transposable element-derived protein domain-containing protein n=1 Tax=Ignelater luminosus TaxID=2038154 RepID=A0A8K0DGX8_IGNLU|nr:hypothetical protein ILUMI_00084 [Ignelater luminosus]